MDCDIDLISDLKTFAAKLATEMPKVPDEKLLNAIYNPPPTPHLVFLDLNMPGKNGFDVLAELRNSEVKNDIPVIIRGLRNSEDFNMELMLHQIGESQKTNIETSYCR